MRQFLQVAVPLLLPTLLYFLYVRVARRGGANAPAPDVPWAWLAIAGALLVVVTLGAVALKGGAPPGSDYEPAKVIDGKIQPGRFSD